MKRTRIDFQKYEGAVWERNYLMGEEKDMYILKIPGGKGHTLAVKKAPIGRDAWWGLFSKGEGDPMVSKEDDALEAMRKAEDWAFANCYLNIEGDSSEYEWESEWDSVFRLRCNGGRTILISQYFEACDMKWCASVTHIKGYCNNLSTGITTNKESVSDAKLEALQFAHSHGWLKEERAPHVMSALSMTKERGTHILGGGTVDLDMSLGGIRDLVYANGKIGFDGLAGSLPQGVRAAAPLEFGIDYCKPMGWRKVSDNEYTLECDVSKNRQLVVTTVDPSIQRKWRVLCRQYGEVVGGYAYASWDKLEDTKVIALGYGRRHNWISQGLYDRLSAPTEEEDLGKGEWINYGGHQYTLVCDKDLSRKYFITRWVTGGKVEWSIDVEKDGRMTGGYLPRWDDLEEAKQAALNNGVREGWISQSRYNRLCPDSGEELPKGWIEFKDGYSLGCANGLRTMRVVKSGDKWNVLFVDTLTSGTYLIKDCISTHAIAMHVAVEFASMNKWLEPE